MASTIVLSTVAALMIVAAIFIANHLFFRPAAAPPSVVPTGLAAQMALPFIAILIGFWLRPLQNWLPIGMVAGMGLTVTLFAIRFERIGATLGVGKTAIAELQINGRKTRILIKGILDLCFLSIVWIAWGIDFLDGSTTGRRTGANVILTPIRFWFNVAFWALGFAAMTVVWRFFIGRLWTLHVAPKRLKSN